MSDPPRKDQPKVYLASASPRRAKLLRDAGIAFEQMPSPFDEDYYGGCWPMSAYGATRILATKKAEALAETLPAGIVIGCDTLLSVDGLAQGKPDDAEEAEMHLRHLIGRSHEVITSVCIVDIAQQRQRLFTDIATVTIGDMPRATLDAYIECGAWRGKAGGYNYAELADKWPISVEGDPDTVVGLPVRRLKDELACITHPMWDAQATRDASGGRGSARAASRHDAIMSGADRSLCAKLVRFATLIGEAFYLPAVNWRNKLYDMGWKRVAKVKLPVVSVGNITAGGTGKTPMVMHIVRLLQRHGHRPAIVLRGYRSTAEHGSDEARLYEQHLPGVPVIVNPDRVAAAAHVEREYPSVTVLVLDDAFQHRRIARDFDLVLLDAANPFGHGHLLPRGLLREPMDNLLRADAVVLTHVEMADYNTVSELDDGLTQTLIAPAAWFAHAWSQVLDERDQPVTMNGVPGRVLAFCGIGNPAGFLTEAKHRFDVAETAVFADHHAYTADDLSRLQSMAKTAGAAALLTTEKDWVKVHAVIQSAPKPPDLPIWRPQLSLTAIRGGDTLERMLLEHIAPPPVPSAKP